MGAARGRPIADDLYVCEELKEKPDPAWAARNLASEGLPDGRYLAHGGIYLFTAEIFDCLRQLARAYRPAGEELQLTDAEAMLLRRRPGGLLLRRLSGRCLDAGTPAGYADAQAAIRAAPCHS